jgi:hypothetical protein
VMAAPGNNVPIGGVKVLAGMDDSPRARPEPKAFTGFRARAVLVGRWAGPRLERILSEAQMIVTEAPSKSARAPDRCP